MCGQLRRGQVTVVGELEELLAKAHDDSLLLRPVALDAVRAGRDPDLLQRLAELLGQLGGQHPLGELAPVQR